MISATICFLLALAFTASATPIVRRYALQMRAVDEPTARRIHSRIIPRSGGIAIVFGVFAALLLLLALKTDVARALGSRPRLLVGLFLGSLIVAALGVVDDVVGVRAKKKLALQVLAAVVAYAAGFRIEAMHLPFMGAVPLGYLALPATVLWICAVINALNLIDGLDGLAAGVALFACLTNFVIAFMGGNFLVCLLSATLAGAILGFLFYNFNPATIFMGDSGSMFLGYMLATISLFGAGSRKGGTAIAIVVPLLALGVPIMDMLLAMVRRFLAGRSIFSADRGHIHHRLVDMGLTHRRAVLVLYALCVLFTAVALAVHIGRSWQVGLSLAALVFGVVGVARFVGFFSSTLSARNRRFRQLTADVERLRRSLPETLRTFDVVMTRAQLRQKLEDFGQTASLASVELLEAETTWRWRRADVSDRQLREAVRSSYALQLEDGEGGELVFVWDAELGEVTPQAAILLQVVSDTVERALARSMAASAATASAGTQDEASLRARAVS